MWPFGRGFCFLGHLPLGYVAEMMKPVLSASDDDIPCKRVVGTLVLTTLLLGGPYAIYQAACILWPMKWTLLALIAAAEWFFYVCYYRTTYEDFNKIPPKCQPKDFTPADGIRTWNRFINLMNKAKGIHIEEYIRPWFLNAPMSDIKEGNVAEMLTYGFFYRKREEMPADLAQFPLQMVKQLEQALNVKFPPGYTPGLGFMSHLWEDLRAHYRPLALYVFMEIMAKATRLIMTSYGFKIKRMGLLTYYTLNCGIDFPESASNVPASTPQHDEDDEWTPFAAAPERSQGSTRNPLNDTLPENSNGRATPVMFLHGVGGLILYLEMLKHVIALGHPVIVIEYKHVAMRLCSYLPTVDEVTETVVRILETENIPRVCVVGHSYGSFMASRLNSLHKEKVHSLCLVDPVCFGMFMPQLLHNFIYRRPRIDWKHPDVLIRDLALFFASRDVHLAATFCRRFYWTDINLWPDDLGPGSCIVLSGNDDLCNADGAKKMLEAAGQAKVILNPSLFHGAILLDTSSKAALLMEVKALLDTSGSLVVRLARPVVDRTLSAAKSILVEVGDLTTRFSHNPGDGVRQLRRTFTELPARTWTPIVKKVTGSTSEDKQPEAIRGREYLRTRSSIHTNFIHSLASLRERIPGGASFSAPTSPQPQQQRSLWQQQKNSAPAGPSPVSSAEAGVAAVASGVVQMQGSLRDGNHRAGLATIDSISEEKSPGPSSNRSSINGNVNHDRDAHAVLAGVDQQHRTPPGPGGGNPAAPGESDWEQADATAGSLDQQQRSAPAAGGGAGGKKFSDALRNSRASRLVRRAFTSWNSANHKQWQNQQQQQEAEEAEQQRQQQLQEEAAQLQRMLHHQQ